MPTSIRFAGANDIHVFGGDERDPAVAFDEIIFAHQNTAGIWGNGGNDWLWASISPNGPSTFYGGDGDDVLVSFEYNDWLEGGDGDDILIGGNGSNILIGGQGDDWLWGGSGSDNMTGGEGDDVLVGELTFGNPATGNDATDILDGGLGDDVVIGGHGDDELYGSDGDDWLWGGRGFDRIDGGWGKDVLIAQDGGAMMISGNDGLRDIMIGHVGSPDIFVSTSPSALRDYSIDWHDEIDPDPLYDPDTGLPVTTTYRAMYTYDNSTPWQGVDIAWNFTPGEDGIHASAQFSEYPLQARLAFVDGLWGTLIIGLSDQALPQGDTDFTGEEGVLREYGILFVAGQSLTIDQLATAGSIMLL